MFSVGLAACDTAPPEPTRALASVTESSQTATAPPSFVGADQCVDCHAEQKKAWTGSHHDLAIDEATQKSVLADFDDVTVNISGTKARFFRRDDKHLVNTLGGDGKSADFEVTHTFGTAPLQQYLLKADKGRHQAFVLAWDTRPKKDGGQRWFSLYADEKIAPDDPLHWTGPNQNWNFMCAECHSTNLQKGYDIEKDAYTTTWTDLDVSCEACHGPGSNHVAWANADAASRDERWKNRGLTWGFAEEKGSVWKIDPETGSAKRHLAMGQRTEVDVCGRCHSRRSLLHEGGAPTAELLDTHAPSLLVDPLYHADGQIRDEVYVYGSFLQSKMHAAGVSCMDCHDPHGLGLKAEGNVLCGQCHDTKRFDTPAHHHHPKGSKGAQCVECHMPATTYMVVDPRRDHSFRIPRPDLSDKIGAPNACTRCHDDRDAKWAAAAVSEWVGAPLPSHYGEALHAGRTRASGAADQLLALARDEKTPAIVRATALTLAGSHGTPKLREAIESALSDSDPLMRRAAASASDTLAPPDRFAMLKSLLEDRVRGVRIEAARVLASVPRDGLSKTDVERLDRAIDEYIAAQHANAERPESHVNVGTVEADRGRVKEAEKAYRTALRLEPKDRAARFNLADLRRLQGNDRDGRKVLEALLDDNDEDADAHHALGLLLIRQKKREEAVVHIGKAAKLTPSDPRYAYAYALLLNEGGKADEALSVIRGALDSSPDDRSLLFTLATMSRDRGKVADALAATTRLLELNPDDREARALAEQLRKQ